MKQTHTQTPTPESRDPVVILGHNLGNIWEGIAEYVEDETERTDQDRRLKEEYTLGDMSTATEDMISVLMAESLEGATVQAMLAFAIAGRLKKKGEITGGDRVNIRALERFCYSIFLILVEKTGVDSADFGAEHFCTKIKSPFPPSTKVTLI